MKIHHDILQSETHLGHISRYYLIEKRDQGENNPNRFWRRVRE